MGFRARHAVLVAVAVAACGAPPVLTASPRCTPPPPPPSPRASVPPASATADRARVDPGGAVNFSETITGPVTVSVDCQQPLQVIVSDSTQLHIFSGQSPGAEAGHCGTLTLSAGQSETYTVTWPVDETLPGGAYTVELLLGSAPQLTLSVAIGTVPRC